MYIMEVKNKSMAQVHEVIRQAILDLYNEGQEVKPLKWQSVEVEQPMIEITQRYYQMKMPSGQAVLQSQCKADQPWSEDHFQERVSGEPLNPGDQYYNWPYYAGDKDNDRFREGDKQFSHSYMERYWPPHDLKGIRYNYGDLNDLVDRIVADPLTRQAYLSVWYPEDQIDIGERVPCTLGYHFLIRNDKLDCTYLIRSCDARRHFKNDIYLTIRLAQWLVEKLDMGLNLGNLNMWIGSLHAWALEREMLKAGTV